MSVHFSAVSLTSEAPNFSPARNGKASLAVWGLVLGSLLFGVTMVAAVTVSTWAQAASIH